MRGCPPNCSECVKRPSRHAPFRWCKTCRKPTCSKCSSWIGSSEICPTCKRFPFQRAKAGLAHEIDIVARTSVGTSVSDMRNVAESIVTDYEVCLTAGFDAKPPALRERPDRDSFGTPKCCVCKEEWDADATHWCDFCSGYLHARCGVAGATIASMICLSCDKHDDRREMVGLKHALWRVVKGPLGDKNLKEVLEELREVLSREASSLIASISSVSPPGHGIGFIPRRECMYDTNTLGSGDCES